jgi:nicotinate-nucleotide adenylyltransferase
LSNARSLRRRIGVFGGSFDPVHLGHISLIQWALHTLSLDELRVVPAFQSWQKNASSADSQHRLNMLALAIQSLPIDLQPKVSIDSREIKAQQPSYTVPTLEALRNELGPDVALVLLMGSDQLHNLATWHRYPELLNLAHIAVTQRESIGLQNFPAPVQKLIEKHGQEVLPNEPSGALVFFRMPVMPVSSTRLRGDLVHPDLVAPLLPPPVFDYICNHRLYSQGV